VIVMDEYQWVRMRGDEMVREAELARLAAEARRSARPADRSQIRPVRRLMLAAARLWHGPAYGRRGLGAWSSVGGGGAVR
jgi:hypothetical protein